MQPVEDSFRFPANERIKSSLTIKTVVEKRKFVAEFPIKCFYRFVERNDNKLPDKQLAVVVSKRWFKHAVDRNRIKRLMRESYRLQKHTCRIRTDELLQMCWLYVGKKMPDYGEIYKSAQRILEQLNQKANSHLEK